MRKEKKELFFFLFFFHFLQASSSLLNPTAGDQMDGGGSNQSDSHEVKTRARKDIQSLQYVLKSLVAGGVSGCCAKTVIAPLDRIKILFQASNPHYQQFSGTFGGVFRALSVVSSKEGPWAHFKGHTATLARIFPYAALQYMSYEQFKTVSGPIHPPYHTLMKHPMSHLLICLIKTAFERGRGTGKAVHAPAGWLNGWSELLPLSTQNISMPAQCFLFLFVLPLQGLCLFLGRIHLI